MFQKQPQWLREFLKERPVSASSRRGCAFCGGLPLTKEHAWPAWAIRALQLPHGGTVTRSSSRGDVDRDGFQLGPPGLTVRKICAHCNNGWMSQLEDATRPFLEPMVMGTDHQILDASQQRVLARWICKTVLVTCLLTDRDPPIVPPFHFAWFGAEQEPLPDALIWIGAYDFDVDGHSGMSSSTSSHKPAGPGYNACINLGSFVALVIVAPNLQTVSEFDLPPDVAPHLQRVWPPDTSSLQWPVDVMDSAALHAVSGVGEEDWESWTPPQ